MAEISDSEPRTKTVKVQVVTETIVYERPRIVVHPDVPTKKPGYVKITDLQEDQKEHQCQAAEFSRIEVQIKRAQSFAQALGLTEDYNRLLSAFQTFQMKLKAKVEAQKVAMR